MRQQRDYVIPFKGLSTGSHDYRFEVDNAFFEGFEYFETETGKIDVELELLKESSLLDLHFKIYGNVELVCDRCLGNFTKHIKGDFRLVVKFGESYTEESEEVIIIPNTENTIDVRHYIFEYINLLLPIKRTHKYKKECDPEMLKKLQNHIEQNTDPRWDVLKDIKLK